MAPRWFAPIWPRELPFRPLDSFVYLQVLVDRYLPEHLDFLLEGPVTRRLCCDYPSSLVRPTPQVPGRPPGLVPDRNLLFAAQPSRVSWSGCHNLVSANCTEDLTNLFFHELHLSKNSAISKGLLLKDAHASCNPSLQSIPPLMHRCSSLQPS